ncbi:Ig-like domain-containing protein [Microbacterium oxydans]|uniref:Ig-like domain-containing protein n=1 Tax=Microbacterium oxydans TaxID=82380 RepID=UPI00226B4351|nr:Ig-like domain-containing protein [Microbacterium oxydans]WAA67964.1 hypothetical protein MME74_15395 [Microbacterium oxydans]
MLTKGLAAASLTAAVLAAGIVPAQAATTQLPTENAPTAAQNAFSTISVDTVHAGDRYITGKVTGDARTVRVLGVIPGRGLDGTVEADGSFRVDLSPFASRIYPMQRLNTIALDASGRMIGSSVFIVEFGEPDAPAPERDLLVGTVTSDSTRISGSATPGTSVVIDGIPGARPGAVVTKDGNYTIDVGRYTLTAGQELTAVNVNASTLEPLGKQVTFTVGAGSETPAPEPSGDIEANPFRMGQYVVTGTAPAGSTSVAVEILGTTQFGTIDETGKFSVPVGSLIYMLRPGVTISVWASDADGNSVETEITVSR